MSLLLAIAICTVLSLSSANKSVASTSYVLSTTDPAVSATCASLGGSWDGSKTCTLGSNFTLNSGDRILIDPGAILAIPSGVTIANDGAIQDYGTLADNAGGFVANSGTITAFIANGSIINFGTMTNNADGSIVVEHLQQSSPYAGTFDFINSGTFSNLGSFVNFGNLTNAADASISNFGTFSLESATINTGKFSAPLALNAGHLTNAAGATVTESGATINNTGTITNLGTIVEEQNVFSKINNLGTITTNGTITNVGFLVNLGTFVNSGMITNFVGCSTTSCGTLANSGILVNEVGGTIINQGNYGNFNGNLRRPQLGTLTNNGTFINMEVFTNALGGTTTNFGVINNSASFTNLSSISNAGSIT